MSWLAILSFALGTYALRVTGPLFLGRRVLSERTNLLMALVPVAMLSALAALATVQAGDAMVIDARIAAMGVAVIAIAMRAPFIAVVLLSALVAAGLRWLDWAP